ncbi:MAG: hypothetical protein ACTH8J_14895 [Specibacter sp.]
MERTESLEGELAALETESAATRARGVPQQYWVDVGYQQHQLQAELQWVRKLCADIGDGTLPWTRDAPHDPDSPGAQENASSN